MEEMFLGCGNLVSFDLSFFDTSKVKDSLSQNRAQTVADYIISKGIPASSVTPVGFGSARPVDTNDTPAGRARNRRVEVHLSVY